MQVTETLSEGLKRGFTVTVPAAGIESKRTARLKEVGQTMKLPGFRPGKVPMSILQQRYGEAVQGEVMEQVVSEATRGLLDERGLRPAMQPKVDVVSGGEPGSKDDLKFTVEFEVLPKSRSRTCPPCRLSASRPK